MTKKEETTKNPLEKKVVTTKSHPAKREETTKNLPEKKVETPRERKAVMPRVKKVVRKVRSQPRMVRSQPRMVRSQPRTMPRPTEPTTKLPRNPSLNSEEPDKCEYQKLATHNDTLYVRLLNQFYFFSSEK